MMRKKLLSLPILLLFVLSILGVNMTLVSALEYPAIMVVPESTVNETLTLGTNFTISIYTDYTGDDIIAYQFTLSYNPSVIHGVEVVNGDVIVGGSPGSARFEAGTFDNEAGTLSLTVGYYFEEGDVASGPGILANVTFTVVGEGGSNITIGDETQLWGGRFDWDIWDYVEYIIIDAETMPDHIQHGYFQNVLTVTHDIAVTSVTPSTSSVPLGDFVDITVVVENQGNVNEAFNVIAYANNTAIETKTVANLASHGASTSLTFVWNTTDAEVGTYIITATASILPGETDTMDNTLESEQTVTVFVAEYRPVAIITADETVALANETLVFSGEDSHDPDGGTIVSWEWDFGDGTSGTGTMVTHAYNETGFYDVTLNVTDSQNQWGAAILTIEIEEEPPPPPPYAADLVKWKARAEHKNWDYSKDEDKKLTLTALPANLGAKPVDVNIIFAIIDAATGLPANETYIGPIVSITLERAWTAPISVDLNPFHFGFDGETKIVVFAHVTLEYYDADTETWISASTKIVRIAIVP